MMGPEAVRHVVRERIKSLQQSIDDNRSALAEREQKLAEAKKALQDQENEMIGLKQWLANSGAEDINGN